MDSNLRRGRVPRATTIAALATPVLGLATGSPAQISPNGSEFQVDSYTTSRQEKSTVASDSQGNFVMVWQGSGSSGTDTSSGSIRAQRYAANGAPLGGQFQVDTYAEDIQYAPAVASDSQGAFVVVWRSFGSSGTHGRGPLPVTAGPRSGAAARRGELRGHRLPSPSAAARPRAPPAPGALLL